MAKLTKFARAAAFHLALKPMILVNYWLRAKHILPDEWFWADVLATRWGYSVSVRMNNG